MTYVLILIFTVGFKGGMTNIPGYKSLEDCKAAGAEYARQAKGDVLWSAYCIPGPRS